MPPIPSRRLTGVTSFRDLDAGTTMASVEELALSPDRVTHRIGPLGDARAGRVIRSTNPAVIHYQHRIVNARAAHMHRLTPPRSVEKPDRTRRTMMVCPLCGGAREEDTGERRQVCRQCGGSGRVRQP